MALNDPGFIDFFHRTCQENNTVEYYLTDEYGSYLLLDSNNTPSWLAVKNEEGMRTAYEIAEDAEIPLPASVLEEIKRLRKMPYFDKNGLYDYKHIYPVKNIRGKSVYYYTLINDPCTYPLNHKNGISYKEYLHKG